MNAERRRGRPGGKRDFVGAAVAGRTFYENAMRLEGLTPNDVRVVGALVCLVSMYGWRADRLAQSQIMKMANANSKAVGRALNRLEAAGLIRTEGRRGRGAALIELVDQSEETRHLDVQFPDVGGDGKRDTDNEETGHSDPENETPRCPPSGECSGESSGEEGWLDQVCDARNDDDRAEFLRDRMVAESKYGPDIVTSAGAAMVRSGTRYRFASGFRPVLHAECQRLTDEHQRTRRAELDAIKNCTECKGSGMVLNDAGDAERCTHSQQTEAVA